MNSGDTVLLIDDNPANLAVISDFLSESGYRILIARDGESAVAKALHGRPDIILLDVMLPGIDGFETCRRLKAEEELKEVPVIFTSALSETKDKVDGFAAGGIDYITKPFRYEEVLARVGTHLEIRKARMSLAERNDQLAREIEERKRAEAELRAIRDGLERRVEGRTAELRESNRLLRTLGECNRALVRASSEEELFDEICRILAGAGGYRSAWIGYPGKDGSDTLVPLAWEGELQKTPTPPDWGRGGALESMRLRESLIADDGAACVPLSQGGTLIGVLAVMPREPIGEDELGNLGVLAGDISFGVLAMRTKESLVGSLREKTALLSEVHHRVKNNLQIISSMLRLQADRAKDRTAKEVLKDCENRVMAISIVHECLYSAPDLNGINFPEYVRDILGEIFLGDPGRLDTDFRLSLDPVWLSIDEAVPCGIILVELLMNALRHAFPKGRRPGERRIDIVMKEEADGKVALKVSDTGVGLPPGFDPAKSESLGMHLLQVLVAQLRGEFRFDRGPGASFEVSFVRKPEAAPRGGMRNA